MKKLKKGKHQASVSFDKPLHDKVVQQADDMHTSISWVVNRALEVYFKEVQDGR